MDGWYYTRGEANVGPVPLARLKQLARSGELAAEDQVWHPSLAGWTVARKVPGLTPPAAAGGPGAARPSSALVVAGPPTPFAPPTSTVESRDRPDQTADRPAGPVPAELIEDHPHAADAITILRRGRPWLMVVAVAAFAGAGLGAVAGVQTLIGGQRTAGPTATTAPASGGAATTLPVAAALAYLAAAAVALLVGLQLVKSFTAIGRLDAPVQADGVVAVLRPQLMVWRIVGLAAAVSVVVFLLMFGLSLWAS